MVKAYTLRPEYEDTLTGGTISLGPDANKTIDVLEALKAGGGEIVTADTVEQSALENYWGAEGPVFKVAIAEGDKRTSIEIHTGGPLEGPVGGPPQARAPVTATATATSEPITTVPDAQHGEGSDYQSFSVGELREIIVERNITGVSSKANKEDLIAALEAADEVQQETAEHEVDQQGEE